MSRHYLYGPVTAEFANDNLAGERQTRRCVAFNASGGVDLTISGNDTWKSFRERLPAGWQPEFLVLNLWYTSIPSCLWQTSLPIVGLAVDWNLQWHFYRRRLAQCDLILTDTLGVETLRRAGLPQARAATLYSCSPRFMDMPTDGARDIDILFVGNFHPAIQDERLPWLARLAKLSDKYGVAVRTGVFGDDYRKLLARAKIVFNRSIRGEANQRTFEAAAAGALLFQEAGNREVPEFFADRKECVCYTDATLEPLLAHYLEHDEERRTIAAAARARLAEFTADQLWNRQLQVIEGEWPRLVRSAEKRLHMDTIPELMTRTWQMLGASFGDDSLLLTDLMSAVAKEPRSAELHNALGLVTACVNRSHGRFTEGAIQTAVGHFHRALECDPFHIVGGLNLIEALAALGQNKPAVELTGRLLQMLDRDCALSAEALDGGHFPPGFDQFRVAWEKAAWRNAGQPAAEIAAKRMLLRWRLHTLLAEMTGDLHHFEQAALAYPSMPLSRAALGCALARAGRTAEALPQLRTAVTASPFDRQAARALYEALGAAGNGREQLELAKERLLLSQAAPEAVPAEDWFAAPPPITASATPPEPLGIVWEGAQATVHSLALVNRELCLRLIQRGHDVALAPTGGEESDALVSAMPEALRERYRKPLSRAVDVHIGHQWPPNFAPPPAGHWVLMQPWEFGSLPAAWLRPMSEEVDAVWVYSRYLRECFLRSGVPADRVQVLPLGVDTQRFRPEAPPLPLETKQRFKFLFVGGTIFRKGIDVLLEAYAQAFTAADDVCLVVKDMGNGTFYRGQTAEGRIAEIRARPNAPTIEYIERTLSGDELTGLYTACDCLAAPYRGEGFGLPIAEAMASGLPVIVTGHGAALDFCTEEIAFLVPAQLAPLPENRVGDLPTVGRPWLAEPDLPILRHWLRYVFEHPAEAQAKGRAGCERIQREFTWERSADVLIHHLEELRKTPARRLNRPTTAAASAVPTAEGVLPVEPKALRDGVALCMIVKNEEANLAECLTSAAGLFQEINICDTGSTDRTVEIAKQFGARVSFFPWVDSFAAARNASMKTATCKWIFWLDADDRLNAENREILARLFAQLPDGNVAVSMKTLCLPNANGAAEVVDHVRLFRNLPEHIWTYRVHEQMWKSVRENGGRLEWSDAVVHHTGYRDPALEGKKAERNLRLLRMELAEQPNDPFTLFNLAAAHLNLHQPREALPYIHKSLQLSHPSDSIVRKLYADAARCHRLLGEKPLALQACLAGRKHYREDPELLLEEGLARQELGDLPGAEACFQKLQTAREGAHFASINPGLQGYVARHQLAMLYIQQRRFPEAEAQWRLTLLEQPQHSPAFQGLGEVYLAQQRWSEFEHVVAQLSALPHTAGPVLQLRVAAHLARREYDRARQLALEAIGNAPHEVLPRRLLSHALLQEGKDWAAAERALRELLALAPNDPEALSNLGVLLRQLARG